MELKTKVHAEDGRQDLTITREFDLPANLVYLAYTDAGLVAQWMDNTVLKLENKKHGSYEFEKRDKAGKVVFSASGTIHDVIPNKKIIRTFEMYNAPFGVQLEVLEFEATGENTSKLFIHSIYESAQLRDQLLKFPFAPGINMAHNKLEEILKSK